MNRKANTKITVIVPVYNSQSTINKLMNALNKQTYPKKNIQIIFIDNGSTDNSVKLIKKFKQITLLSENRIQSSYVARNKGLAHAKGEIIAFTDSDCIPSKNWLESGLKYLKNQDADIVAGSVEFIYNNKKSAVEIYDALNHIRPESSVKEKKSAPTANLFSKKKLFEEIGYFPQVKSGGDFIWTKNAANKGKKILYCHEAKVFHPTRDLRSTITKELRLGTGLLKVWKNEQKTTKSIILNLIRLLLPPKISSISEKLEKAHIKKSPLLIPKLWLVTYLAKICKFIGFIFTKR